MLAGKKIEQALNHMNEMSISYIEMMCSENTSLLLTYRVSHITLYMIECMAEW